MLCKALVEHCAPTLAGIKTGNIFSVKNNGSDLIGEIRSLNSLLTPKGLRLVPVKRDEKMSILYLYRPELLKRDLTSPEAVGILNEKGYPDRGPEYCLAALVKRLMDYKVFPHEIGLFLGYPPVDVKGFIESPCKGFKCVGCWKVYGNVKEAESTFERYKRCTDTYCREMKEGRPFESLIVAQSSAV